VGHENGTKIGVLNPSLALLTLKSGRMKQANGAILMTQRRQASLGGVWTGEMESISRARQKNIVQKYDAELLTIMIQLK